MIYLSHWVWVGMFGRMPVVVFGLPCAILAGCVCTQAFTFLPAVGSSGCVVWFLGGACKLELAADRLFFLLVLWLREIMFTDTPGRTKLVKLAAP